MLEVISLSQSFEQKTLQLLQSFSLNTGDVLWVFGSNGAGKTTLLELLSHIQRGQVSMRYFGQVISFRDRAYIEQIDLITPNDILPNFMNIAQYCEYHDIRQDNPFIKHLPSCQSIATLSQGQRQRLRLARIKTDAKVIFLDEPSTALDHHGVELLWDLVKNFHHQGTIVLIADHAKPSFHTKAFNCDQEISQN